MRPYMDLASYREAWGEHSKGGHKTRPYAEARIET